MKVEMTKESNNVVTVSEMPTVTQMIKGMKDDTYSADDYAKMAARVMAGSNGIEILRSKAMIAKNSRVWNRYTDDSGNLDIWIEFVAMVANGIDGIIIGGAYLSDIWDITGDDENDMMLRQHMYIRKFKEV